MCLSSPTWPRSAYSTHSQEPGVSRAPASSPQVLACLSTSAVLNRDSQMGHNTHAWRGSSPQGSSRGGDRQAVSSREPSSPQVAAWTGRRSLLKRPAQRGHVPISPSASPPSPGRPGLPPRLRALPPCGPEDAGRALPAVPCDLRLLLGFTRPLLRGGAARTPCTGPGEEPAATLRLAPGERAAAPGLPVGSWPCCPWLLP